MRIAFAGTPAFARAALAALLAAGHDVALVLTQPDRPAGRGLAARGSSVKEAAVAAGRPVVQPRGLRLDGRFAEDAEAARLALLAAAPEVLIVAAYGLILPRWALALAPHGALNIHASVLPRWRGAAPIQRAIEAGDTETGITLMQMDEGLDTGDIRRIATTPIGAQDTGGSLHDRLAALGAREVVAGLAELEAGTLARRPQPAAGATYAKKIEKAEAAIRWRESAAAIERRARAFDPAPGLAFALDGEPVKLWRAEVAGGSAGAEAGTVLAAGGGRFEVACGEGVLRLVELQRAGGRRVGAADFLRGRPVTAGRVLGSAGG
jgi:methionyl-tRNA formyltransferase